MSFRTAPLHPGMKVEIYRNLHKGCLSVRHNGRVIRHLLHGERLTLEDVSLVVGKAGRERVLREKRKNVHAFIRGTVAALLGPPRGMPLHYNPYTTDSWLAGEGETLGPVTSCERVHFGSGRPLAEF